MEFVLVQFLEGLAAASSLFLVAAGLSLIFGVSRVVNFAHGSLYMLGAYAALSLSPAIGFWAAVPAAALLVGLGGIALELLLMRRIYAAPELFQLLATFAVTLIAADAVPLLWGPDDVLGPRAPGLTGSVEILGRAFPAYDLFLIFVGPVVMAALWLLLKRTRFGVLLRAAASDREMLGALGVDQKILFTAVFGLGAALAGLGGALALPREAVNPAMSGPIVVAAFVVVVVGGLGSLPGAFLAALLIGEVSAFGVALWPKATLVLMFAAMAGVLMIRPRGLLGARQRTDGAPALAGAPSLVPLRLEVWAGAAIWLALAVTACSGYRYLGNIAAEIAVMALFAASLSLLTGLGGMTSFGQAAWFALGAYAAALLHPLGGFVFGLAAAPVVAGMGGFVFAALAVRNSGITLAMLTLALAEMVHSIAVQAYGLTGGDNGIVGVWPSGWAAVPGHYQLIAVAAGGMAVALAWLLSGSSLGFAIRAVRDDARRAEASGIGILGARRMAFALSAAMAGLAGGLFAYLKGSVFPDAAAIDMSVDGLVVLLLGGIGCLLGPVAGAIAYIALKVGFASHSDLWRLAAGTVVLGVVLLLPGGLLHRRTAR